MSIRSVLSLGLLAFLVAGVPAFSQFGRYPGGGGGYPGGRSPYPGGGGVNLPPPVPGGGSQTRNKKDKPDEPLPTLTGVVRSSDRKMLMIEGPESNTVQLNCTKKTKFYDGDSKIKPADLKRGDHVSVEARRAPDGTLDAVEVHREHEKSQASKSPS
jgi:hypothetical protein